MPQINQMYCYWFKGGLLASVLRPISCSPLSFPAFFHVFWQRLSILLPLCKFLLPLLRSANTHSYLALSSCHHIHVQWENKCLCGSCCGGSWVVGAQCKAAFPPKCSQYRTLVNCTQPRIKAPKPSICFRRSWTLMKAELWSELQG